MILATHNGMRWLILLAAGYALFTSYRGWLSQKPYDKRPGRVFTALLHIQLLVACAVYASSPLVHAAWHDMSATMHQRDLRFFSIEHPFQMLIAIAVATYGQYRARKSQSWKTAALSQTLAIVLIATVIPWPFSSHPRRWLPF